ncbi:MAG: DNA polymerase IV, partial [Candidatus Omnitrophica bacterium]|nr:DNA polymerase IV [Candidatus Omnitrophota bacterium]
ANGIDEAEVVGEHETKSMSSETTFEKDTANEELIKRTLLLLSEDVSSRLRQDKLKARTITLKIRLSGFKTYTRALTIQKATNFVNEINKAAKIIYEKFILQEDKRIPKIRLLGVKASGLMPQDIKDSLFDEKTDQKKENIHKAVDVIKEKFGNKGIFRAAEIE